MTHTAKRDVDKQKRIDKYVSAAQRAVDQFTQQVVEQFNALDDEKDRARILAFTQRALDDMGAMLLEVTSPSPRVLSVSRLKASEVISQGLVDLSQATLYRAAENGRFYSITPNGRSIGREFPSWQFVKPVPELIHAVLTELAGQPSSEIHAFWVTALDELNELSPAEVLAGKPFESRNEVHKSQQHLMDMPTSIRLQKIKVLAALHSRGMVEIIS